MKQFDKILLWHADAKRAESTAEDLNSNIERELAPHISRWEEIEPPGCGHTGGWEFQEISIEENVPVVRLEHRCFYAHRYDLDDRYYATVPLDKFLDTHYRPKVR